MILTPHLSILSFGNPLSCCHGEEVHVHQHLGCSQARLPSLPALTRLLHLDLCQGNLLVCSNSSTAKTKLLIFLLSLSLMLCWSLPLLRSPALTPFWLHQILITNHGSPELHVGRPLVAEPQPGTTSISTPWGWSGISVLRPQVWSWGPSLPCDFDTCWALRTHQPRRAHS